MKRIGEFFGSSSRFVVKLVIRLIILPMIMLAIWLTIFEWEAIQALFVGFYTTISWKFWLAVASTLLTVGWELHKQFKGE